LQIYPKRRCNATVTSARGAVTVAATSASGAVTVAATSASGAVTATAYSSVTAVQVFTLNNKRHKDQTMSKAK